MKNMKLTRQCSNAVNMELDVNSCHFGQHPCRVINELFSRCWCMLNKTRQKLPCLRIFQLNARDIWCEHPDWCVVWYSKMQIDENYLKVILDVLSPTSSTNLSVDQYSGVWQHCRCLSVLHVMTCFTSMLITLNYIVMVSSLLKWAVTSLKNTKKALAILQSLK